MHRIPFLFIIFSSIESSIIIYHSEDGLPTQYYDCIYLNSYMYCRRPLEPTNLTRVINTDRSCHSGKRHSFASMKANNISVSEIVEQWRSTLEMAENYARYLENPLETSNQYLCQCEGARFFGKNCEYRLSSGDSFEKLALAQAKSREESPSSMQIHGDTLCYETLDCNFGLLCLDWRDICDGYLLNGEYECMDLTDEKGSFNDTLCTTQLVALECDERRCLPNEWPCGDGQCIDNRTSFQDEKSMTPYCRSGRDQLFMCETHGIISLWTMDNGRCNNQREDYGPLAMRNYSAIDQCIYYLKCQLSTHRADSCTCIDDQSCFEKPCSIPWIPYPKGNILTPYISLRYRFNSEQDMNLPDQMIFNGTIKCRGYLVTFYYEMPYTTDMQLRSYEDMLCNFEHPNFTRTPGGYDLHCNANTNRTDFFIDVCKRSKECISAYRIEDGFYDCADESDENSATLVSYTCAKIRHHRFQCSTEETTCLSVNSLGDMYVDCQSNGYDESWMGFGIRLSKMNCHPKSKEDCFLIREYMEKSWSIDTSSVYQVNSTKRIPFRAYCDTFWDYSSKQDEHVPSCREWWICLENQWQCQTGQCIDPSWVLDGEWDCSDASDEEAIFLTDEKTLERNYALKNESWIEEKFEKLYAHRPLSSVCNITSEFPCYRINASSPLEDFQKNRPCISLEKLGDNHIDCLGALDEQNTVEYCNSATMLGRNFKCLTSHQCHPYSMICDKPCSNPIDDEAICYTRNAPTDCNEPGRDFLCYDRTCAKDGWCNLEENCSDYEDEYLCDNSEHSVPKQLHSYHRRDKEFGLIYGKQLFQLPEFPPTTEKRQSSRLNSSTSASQIYSDDIFSSNPFTCNRGVTVLIEGDIPVCFCPQSYYGDQCQYHSDRLTLIFQFNFTHSVSSNILLKVVVLFLFNDQILDSYEFHDRPISPTIGAQSKKIDHFVYSRSKEFLQRKRDRYFNRSQILGEHPYAVRLEAYQIESAIKPQLVAVWKYSIEFDYLPVDRLVKILQFPSLFSDKDPCSSSPCSGRGQCHRVMNKPLSYVCLCLANYAGENCSILDSKCSQGFCSSDSLCKPNYAGSIRHNGEPYCICRNGMFGRRCYLKREQCQSSPCLNNGTCFPASISGGIYCQCQSLHIGNRCQFRKELVQLHVQHSVEHRAAVVQYIDVDLAELNLVLLHQDVHSSLPLYLSHLNNEKQFTDLVLLKLYGEALIGIYLIALHIDVTSINETTFINETNRCLSIQHKDFSPIRYHQICRNNHSMLCFYNEQYWCVCEKNHSRAECFIYDLNFDRCSRCLAGGLCLRGDRMRPEDYLCLCPNCYSGRSCQFNSKSFSFTWDQLFAVDLLSDNALIRGLTFYSLICGSWLIFFIGLMNNLCSFVTVNRPKCRCTSVGQYLLAISLINQLSLTFIACRLTHLVMNITGHRTKSWLDSILCSIFKYLATSCVYISYWLVALIALDRAYITVFFNQKSLKNPSVARRLILCICLVIFITCSYDLAFVRSYPEFNDGQSSICVLAFPVQAPIWSILHEILTIINAVVPLLINITCVIIIIYVVLDKKMKVNQSNLIATIELKSQRQRPIRKENRIDRIETKQSPHRLHLLREVIRENKELVIGPAFTLVPQLFSLPLFFASLLLACQTIETSSIRYLFLFSCCATFIPQIVTFFLYINPSSFYSRQWRSTDLSSKLTRLTGFYHPWSTINRDSIVK